MMCALVVSNVEIKCWCYAIIVREGFVEVFDTVTVAEELSDFSSVGFVVLLEIYVFGP